MQCQLNTISYSVSFCCKNHCCDERFGKQTTTDINVLKLFLVLVHIGIKMSRLFFAGSVGRHQISIAHVAIWRTRRDFAVSFSVSWLPWWCGRYDVSVNDVWLWRHITSRSTLCAFLFSLIQRCSGSFVRHCSFQTLAVAYINTI